MVNIAARLIILLPTLNLDDVMLSSHHGNEQIDYWRSSLVQPSKEELASVLDSEISDYLANIELKRNVKALYFFGAPQLTQINLALNRLSSEEAAVVIQWLNFCKTLYQEKKTELLSNSEADISYGALIAEVKSRITLANRTLLQKIRDYFYNM